MLQPGDGKKKNTSFDCECKPPPRLEIPNKDDGTCSACAGNIVPKPTTHKLSEEVSVTITRPSTE